VIAWKPLHSFDADSLVEARIQLHYAAQLVAAATADLLAATDDASHTSLRYEWRLGALCSLAITTDALAARRFALRFDDFSLALLDGDDRVIERLRLDGLRFGEGADWVEAMVQTWIEPDHRLQISLPQALPMHPLREQATFQSPAFETLATLRDCYHNALVVLQRISAGRSDASIIRIWPYRFDAAVLFSLSDPDETLNPRSVNVGMSPGDAQSQVPYFYVAPRPAPERERLPYTAPPGAWTADPWFGALLKLGEIADIEASRQADAVTHFLHDNLATSEYLLLP